MALAATVKKPTVKSDGKHRPKPPPPPEVQLPGSLAGAPAVVVTMPPVGLSLEYPVMAQALGSGECPPPALTAELQRLGSPPLELAGQSQDMTAPSGAVASPAGSWETATLYSLPTAFWHQLHCLLTSTAEPLTVGLNMKTAQPGWNSQTVAGAREAATAGLEFSLANEPDLYYLPNYAALDKAVPEHEAIAASNYVKLAEGIEQGLGGATVVGPELARPTDWQREFPRVLVETHAATVGVHMYPLSACASPRAVTINGLLSESVANAPERLAWVVSDATAARLPAIISEANSASCGGKTGVSDSPAAAVWAVRFVLSALKTGFREVRFHFSGDPYDPFILRAGQIAPRPIETALVALNQWLPVGSSLRTLPGVRGLDATLTSTPAGAVTMLLDNETGKARPVVIDTPGALHVAVLSAARTGFREQQLTPSKGHVALSVAPSSIIAVSGVTP
jgi:hypothetical protein